MFDDATLRRLVAAATGGDRRAWDELVDGLSGLVWSVVRGNGLFGADAADVSQTVWLRFVEHLADLREPERAPAWLATTARHECYRVLRKRGRSLPVAEPPEPDAEVLPMEGRVVAEEEQRALVAALDRVPARCQQLLRLLIADPPLSYDDISGILDMPKGSIGPTRMRCLDHVRVAMGLAT